MSLREVSRQPGMPSWSVLKVWMLQHPEPGRLSRLSAG
ncbi:hypothetical protein ACLBR5_18525 [Escherichia coli]